MEVYLLDGSFEIMGIIDKCITLEMTKCFYSPGEFTMKICSGVSRLRSAMAIYEPLSNGCYLIEELEYCTEGSVAVRGRSLEALLERRILDGDGRYVGNAEETVRLAVERNTIGDRNLLGLTLGETTGLEGRGCFNADYRNLSEFVYSVLRPFGASYTVELVGNVPTFRVVAGKDRTRSQNRYPPVVFSESMGNVTLKSAVLDVSKRKNTAYVSGSDGRIVTVAISDGNLDRRELYVNARDVTPTEFTGDTEYFDALRVRGLEALERCGGECRYTGSVSTVLGNGAEYSVGDVCDVDTSFGVSLSERITSAKYIFENGSVRVTVSFGEGEVPLTALMRGVTSASV